MMHSSLHFALGMVLGSAWHTGALLKAWRKAQPVSSILLRQLITAYALGLFAIVPNLLRRLGAADSICESVPMNLFLLSPALNSLIKGGAYTGPLVLALMIGLQYALLLAAIARAGRRNVRLRR